MYSVLKKNCVFFKIYCPPSLHLVIDSKISAHSTAISYPIYYHQSQAILSTGWGSVLRFLSKKNTFYGTPGVFQENPERL